MNAMTVTNMATWQCKKRNGALVPFDMMKIGKALWRCFYSIEYDASQALVDEIAQRVINQIRGHRLEVIDVEQVQRFVIQQLWSFELFDAAEHYQNYREQ